MPRKKRKFVVAVDFDGTVVKYRFPNIGELVPEAAWWLHAWHAAGADLALWTMRSDHHLTAARAFCQAEGLPFMHYNDRPQSWSNSPKMYANTYVDDSAFGCPLVISPDEKKPYVDWSVVGPGVLQMIELHES